MQVFEFHFNPNKENNFYFNSFCYTPDNIYEKKLGNLYILGDLKRAFDQEILLQKIAEKTKDNYYKLSGHSPQKAFNESIKKTNEFLQEKKDKEEVFWMGNLDLTIASLKGKKLNLTKTGNAKIFLLRGDKKIDIDSQFKTKKQLNSSDKEFKNIASSELAENDILIFSTKKVAEELKNKNIFDSLVQSIPLSEKKIRRIFYKKQLGLSVLEGALFIFSLNKEKEGHVKKIIPAPNSSKFSFEKISVSGLSRIKNLISNKSLPKPKISISKPNLNFSVSTLPSFPIEKINPRPIKSKKNVFLLAGFCLILLFGFYLFKRDKQQKILSFESELSNIREETEKAEQLIENNKKNQGQEILLDSLDGISSLETKVSLPEETKNKVIELENKIEEKLTEANNLNKVKNINKIAKFDPKEFNPQDITLIEEDIYLSSPFETVIYKININDDNQKEEISAISKIKFISKIEDGTPIFITKEGAINILNNKEIQKKGEFKFEKDIKDFNVYNNNLYFLEKEGAIKKSSYLGDMEWDNTVDWFNNKEKSTAGRVFAVDKNIWILDNDEKIRKYYRGELEETIEINLYPEIKNITDFYTANNLDHLYLLETDTNRILIFNKNGEIVKQLQSKNFNNPIDFFISKDGGTAYLLTSDLELISVDLF
ncbi:MAG: hypothetical protein ACOC1P_06270 [Minisyncoccales bacterium]